MVSELLRIEGLDAVDGPFLRAYGIGLTVEEGQVVALLGGTGAGKSALMRAIRGIRPPDAGRILLRGEPIHGLPPKRSSRVASRWRPGAGACSAACR